MRRIAGSRLLAGLAVVALCAAGCAKPAIDPSSAASPIPSPAGASSSAQATRSAPAASATSGPAGASPTALVDPAPPDIPLTTFTIVCESWGAEPPGDDVDCKLAVQLALSALGPEAVSAVRRFDVRYGEGCIGTAACVRVADVRTVVARTADYASRIIRVARDAAGEIRVWPPAEVAALIPPAFDAPPAAAPSVGPGAPPEVRDRLPLPSCGTETVASPDDYDTAARRCFLAGVDAWTPVELVSTETTDDGPLTRVYRFEGSGPIVQFVGANGRWSATGCAISPIDTIAVFVLVSPCRSRAGRS